MQLRYRAACITAGCAAVLLTVLRLIGGGAYTAALCAAVIAVAVLFFVCGVKPRESLAVSGTPALLAAAAAALTGTALVVSALGDALDLMDGVYPYPQPVTVTALNEILLFVMIVGGLVGGVFCVLTAVRWFSDRQTGRGQLGGIALFPVVWTWGRLIWYMTSFASAVNRFRSLVEVGMLLFEMLFLLVLARYVSGVEEQTPRFAVPIALCTAMLGLTACLTRFIALVAQDAALFSATALVSAPDIGITLLATAWVGGQLFGGGTVAPPLPTEEEPEETPAEEPEEEESVPFLLGEEILAAPDPEGDDEDVIPDEERRPLELEDIINEIINGNL